MNDYCRSLNSKDRLATVITKSCGLGNVLVVGDDNGALVGALLRNGVDAVGVGTDAVSVDQARKKFGERFVEGSFNDMPFNSGEFDGAIFVDCLEFLDPDAVLQVLVEAFRVVRKYVFIRVVTTAGDHSEVTLQNREWWEQRCFDAGLRKHPAYFALVPYEVPSDHEREIFILLEKVPPEAHMRFPPSSWAENNALTMDMSRTIGPLSYARMVRYHWSTAYIKPGDRVLDVGCGPGYGSYLVSQRTRAATIHGVDTCERLIDYAQSNFEAVDSNLSYTSGSLPAFLTDIPDASYEVIFAFETLERVENPVGLLSEFHRLLSPGGRLLVSVPNDWSDETGNDPNPTHLQVYDWDRLTREVTKSFLVEDRYLLNARRAKINVDPPTWEKKVREIRQVAEHETSPPASEWCLMTAMKSPLGNNAPYGERAFFNIAATRHNAIRYDDFYANPWLLHAVVNFGFRMKNADVLSGLCDAILREAPLDTNDYAAALCVQVYLNLERHADASESRLLLSRIDTWLLIPVSDVMQLRWKVSLLFAKARTLTALGDFYDAVEVYEQCYSCDIFEFGIHLATKITEAFYWAGRLAFSMGVPLEAHRHWTGGVDFGDKLLATSVKEITIDRTFPNLYNTGDGVREYTLAWDYIARCANGIHLLRTGRMDVSLLDGSFSGEYATVTSDAIPGQRVLAQTREAVLELAEDLVQTREVLVERTQRLEEAVAKLTRSRRPKWW